MERPVSDLTKRIREDQANPCCQVTNIMVSGLIPDPECDYDCNEPAFYVLIALETQARFYSCLGHAVDYFKHATKTAARLAEKARNDRSATEEK